MSQLLWRLVAEEGATKVRGFSTLNRIVMVSLENDPETRWLEVVVETRGGRLGLRLIDLLGRGE